MKDAQRTFRSNARNGKSQWLSDNFYVLERQANQAYTDCRNIERRSDSDILPGLFERCIQLCAKGILCSEDELIEKLNSSGLSGKETRYLPVVLTCVLIDKAAKGVRMRNESGEKQLSDAINSLRKMGGYDFDFISERLFTAEEFLLKDPSGIYPAMDNESKSEYRQRISAASAKANMSERDFTKAILKKAEENNKHIGDYLIPKRKNTARGYLFLIMEVVMPLSVSVASGFFFERLWIGILLFFPLWELMRHPIERLSVTGVSPKRFLRLSVDDEKVLNSHTLITVTTVMPSAERISELEKHLEQIYLSNCMGNFKVCCLCDFKSADMPRKPEDKIFIKALTEMTDRLNSKYGSGFISAVRPRVYSETQDDFSGRERKRGAITELIRAIKGNPKGFVLLHGDIGELEKTGHIIALDGDTELVFDSARELVAVAEHPINKPVIKNGRVTEGYGILVPKAENRLNEKCKTFFSAVMSGDAGITAYDTLTGERYQDLFGESIFCGKGLINVDVYYTLLDSGLPKERILSHDIVESGYLRAAYLPDIQIAESFPKNVSSFYQRLDRWIRGDWQNIGFIFGKTPLNFISRYKMFDNLRRSLTPAFCVSALCFSAVTQGYEGVFAAVVSLLALSSRNLYSAFSLLFNGGFSMISRLYYSKTLPASLDGFVRAFISVAFSAREAFTGLFAASKAVFRMTVTKKKLLDWTTAAQSDAERNRGQILSLIPSVAVSLFLFLFGLPIHRLAGMIILADIPVSLLSGIKIKQRNRKLSEKQREKLISYASAMWGFFEELCGKENNFLPPDNIQFSPASMVARRTSPTNIGLMLTSFLSARDLGFITTAELAMRLKLSLESIESLEKYEGNLLNWYSTETLKPLNPHFVSTVDSGNFLCCLTVLKEGLREYVSECPSLNEIIEKTEKLIDETNLSPLYNSRRNLFHIGIDAESGRKSDSFYDLYMSEIRTTAYFAVARRIVPKKHWGSMGRILVSYGRYTGLASWTGTMFEYFMPNLFIPAPSGSICDESQKFCLYCQRKRAGRLPFGISESGFYAFDSSLNYQYKAHGVRKLGLKRGLDNETVISPYSSFLTLTTEPQLSVKNLERLEKSGVFGRFGFYEAVDCTKGRNNGDYSVIRSFMSHHVGMSMMSAVNMLQDNKMQQRFMRDSYMNGARSLLEEKLQTGEKVFKDVKTEEIPQIRERVQGKNKISENPSPFSPEAAIYSNGRLSLCITDTGAGVSLFDGLDITAYGDDIFAAPKGFFAVFVTEKEKIPFISAVDRCSGTEFRSEFCKDRVIHTANKNGTALKMITSVLKKKNCEKRQFVIENTRSKKEIKGKLVVYFDPCLEKRSAYSAHPAFSKLFITDEWDDENKCFLFSRRGGKPCAIVAGFVQNGKILHESSRERVLTTPNGVFSLGDKTEFTGERGNPDCCCAFAVELVIKPKEKKILDFITAVEETKEQALNCFLTVKASAKPTGFAENIFYHGTLENVIANHVLPKVVFPALCCDGFIGKSINYGKNDLWSFGVSGDNPIILAETDGSDNMDFIRPYVYLNKMLRNSGIITDLVVSYPSENGYESTALNTLKKILKEEDCPLMFGVNGGVHAADLSSHSYSERCALTETAVYTVRAENSAVDTAKSRFKPLKIIDAKEPKNTVQNANNVKHYNFTEGKISIKNKGKTVDIPWNCVFANQSFGTMVSDKALGFTWALNSRENKLTSWSNDTMSDNRNEAIIIKYNDVFYDLAAIGKVTFTPENALWKGEIEKIKFEVTVSVPYRGTVKKCTVRTTNKSDKSVSFDLIFYCVPVLGVSEKSRGNIRYKRMQNGVVMQSSFADIPGFSALTCDGSADYICLSRKQFFEGCFNNEKKKNSLTDCVSVGKKIELNSGENRAESFYLSWGTTEKAAMMMPEVCKFGVKQFKPPEIRTGDEKTDIFCNSFLYSQVKQSRFYGRTGFYQCSGAYGFRDQLQDSLAFLKTEPEITRRHIIRCSSVQFEQGDVLHWWHVILNKKQIIKGVRTRCSDDRLWLPYVCLEYAEETGDYSIFNVRTPFVKGDKLSEDESERYFVYERTDYKDTILNHCIRAVDISLDFGENGLPLIGSCDWNDGFSRIGKDNTAESVWLGMFLALITEKMSSLCLSFGLKDKSDEYLRISVDLKKNIESTAWQGDRYARILDKTGIFMKGKDYIDILPQAFSVFCGLGENGRADTALKTAFNYLYDKESGVLRVLSPPFNEEYAETVGYIAEYPDGIRENGGQYTHAAVWLAAAMFENGMKEEAGLIINALNPMSYYEDDKKAVRYRAEPYVLAGDVSFGKDIEGRAGWTHFTGSAAWYYRTVEKYMDKRCKSSRLYKK